MNSSIHQTRVPSPQSFQPDECKPISKIPATTRQTMKQCPPLKRWVSEDEFSSSSSLEETSKRPRTIEPSSSSFFPPTPTRDLQSCFRILKHIGEGTFGSVFLALDRSCHRQPKIIKRVKVRDDQSVPHHGFPYTALREIKILQSIKPHENIIKFYEVVTTQDSNGIPEHVFMVLEYMEYDLAAMLRLPELACCITMHHVQSWTRQLLKGCQHLHEEQIVHRDLKPANLLLSKAGVLKIGDFGLARKLVGTHRRHTTSIGTPWYRAPEILIGSSGYNQKVDLWSVGCILYELGCRDHMVKPLFHATTGIDLCKHIDKKFALIQADDTWLAREMVTARKDPVLKEDILLAKLISKLLQLCPKLRLSADQALQNGFLMHDPTKLKMNFPRSTGHLLDVMKLQHRQTKIE